MKKRSNPDWLEEALRRSLRDLRDDPPTFEQVFTAAEAKVARGRRQRRTGAWVAALAAAVVVGVALRPTAPADEFLIQESMLTETQWRAPSDTLLPSRSFDIYQETRWTIPDWPSSTIFEEGTLL